MAIKLAVLKSGEDVIADVREMMVGDEDTPADQKKVADIAENFVLKRWAQRCGQKCADEWNATVGKIVGLTAKP